MRVRVGDREVEIRVVSGQVLAGVSLGDLMAAAGQSECETTAELLRILSDGLAGSGT